MATILVSSALPVQTRSFYDGNRLDQSFQTVFVWLQSLREFVVADMIFDDDSDAYLANVGLAFSRHPHLQRGRPVMLSKIYREAPNLAVPRHSFRPPKHLGPAALRVEVVQTSEELALRFRNTTIDSVAKWLRWRKDAAPTPRADGTGATFLFGCDCVVTPGKPAILMVSLAETDWCDE